jgi:hypothetical protein
MGGVLLDFWRRVVEVFEKLLVTRSKAAAGMSLGGGHGEVCSFRNSSRSFFFLKKRFSVTNASFSRMLRKWSANLYVTVLISKHGKETMK